MFFNGRNGENPMKKFKAFIPTNIIDEIDVDDEGKYINNQGQRKRYRSDFMPNGKCFDTELEAKQFLSDYWSQRIEEEKSTLQKFKKFLKKWSNK